MKKAVFLFPGFIFLYFCSGSATAMQSGESEQEVNHNMHESRGLAADKSSGKEISKSFQEEPAVKSESPVQHSGHEHMQQHSGHEHMHDHGGHPAKEQSRGADESAGEGPAFGAGLMSMPNEFGGIYGEASAIGSGTSLVPVSPTYMWHFQSGDWSWMLHGDVKAGMDTQGGSRGVSRFESQNWFMGMGQRPVGDGEWMVRAMFSLEPFTTS